MGGGTLRADDPHLAVRGVEGATQPLRVALDTHAALLPGARILDDAAPTLLVVAEDADTRHLPGVDLLRLPLRDGRVPVPELLTALHARGCAPCSSKAVPPWRAPSSKPGPSTASSATSPRPCSAPAPRPSPTAGITTIARAVRLDITEAVRVGADLRITAVPTTAVPTTAPKEH